MTLTTRYYDKDYRNHEAIAGTTRGRGGEIISGVPSPRLVRDSLRRSRAAYAEVGDYYYYYYLVKGNPHLFHFYSVFFFC